MADRTLNNDREILATMVRDLRAREQQLVDQIEEQKKKIQQLEARGGTVKRRPATRQQLNRQAQDIADAYAVSELENEQRYLDEVEGNKMLLEELEKARREIEEYRTAYETVQKQYDALAKTVPNADSVEEARQSREQLEELNQWYGDLLDSYAKRTAECKELSDYYGDLLSGYQSLKEKNESLESQIVTLRKRSKDILATAKGYKSEALQLAEKIRQMKILEGVNSRNGHIIDALELAFNENVPESERIKHADDPYTRRKKLADMVKASRSKKVRGTSKSYEETLKRAYESVAYLLAPSATDTEAVSEISGLYEIYKLKYRQNTAADLLNKVVQERTEARLKDATRGKGQKGFVKKMALLGLAAAGVLAILATVFVGVPKLATDKQGLEDDLDVSQQQTLNEAEAGELTRFLGQEENNVGKHYGALTAVVDTAQQVFDNNGITPASLSAVSVRGAEETPYTWENIQSAKSDVESFYRLDENGDLDATCAYAQAVDSYRTSIQEGTAEFSQDLQDYQNGTLEESSPFGVIMDYTETAAERSGYVQKAAPALLSELGFATSKDATIEVSVDATAVKEYNKVLRDNSLGGKALDVESAVYTKATGEVQLLVNCIDGNRQEFKSVVKYTIAPNQNYVSAKTLLAPLANKEVDVTRTSYNYDLEVNADSATVNFDGTEVTGALDVACSISTKYNDKSKTTTVKASALVVVGGEFKEFSVEKTFDGVKTAGDVETTMKASLLKEINRATGASLEMAAPTSELE